MPASDNDSLRDKLERLREHLHAEEGTVSRENLSAITALMDDWISTLERQQEQAQKRNAEFDARLLAIENSRFFQLLRVPGRVWKGWRGRAGQALLRSPLHSPFLRVFGRNLPDDYGRWLLLERPPARPIGRRPKLSVLMAVYKPRLEWLQAAVGSVLKQTYDNWQLCIADDGSPESDALEYLKTLEGDLRVRFIRLTEHRGISAALNQAASLAHGEYFSFLDHDDTLAPEALHAVAEAVQDDWPDLVYSDEDHIDEDRRTQPVFKPGYSPDLLDCCMYMGHLLTVRRAAFEEGGGLRSEFDGSQDYDLALRITQRSKRIRHIPRILYHWRRHPGSTALDTHAKPYAHDAGLRSLKEAVAIRDPSASVEKSSIPNSYRVRWTVPPGVVASLIVCSRNPALVEHCLAAVGKKTAHDAREVVVVKHEPGDGGLWENQRLPGNPVCVSYHQPFNFSRMNNLGAKQANGEVLVFLNDDVEPIEPEWLTNLLAHAMRAEVAVAGPKLLYPSGAIQHAGLAMGILHGVGHLHRDTFGSRYWNWLPFTRNVAAVTGACMAVRRSVFQQLDGFDETFPVNYNDVDLCLRARCLGYEIVIEPNAVLRHSEGRTRTPGITLAERELFEARWGHLMANPDHWYNPNFNPQSEDPSLSPDGPPLHLPAR